MDDLISRKAAIDALGGNEPIGDPSKMDDYDVAKMWERIRIINIIYKLPSAQSETHEERTETHTCDLISRQAAIDALTEYGNGRAVFISVGEAVIRIEQLPLAQPEQSIAEWQKDFREYINMLNIPRDDYKGIMEYINEVPSAQPEIIRCKDCKWKNNHNCTRVVEVWIDDDKFCAWAERRTDA